jgi:hypothetical protein
LVAFLKTLTGEYKGKLITQLNNDDVKWLYKPDLSVSTSTKSVLICRLK